MLIDEAEITLIGGHGGPGRVAFNPGHYGGPSGGNGGKGGDIYITVTSDLTALNQFTHVVEFEAEKGEAGGSNKKTGANGRDLEIQLPIGTTLIDQRNGETIDLDQLDQKILIAKGGKGGKGNWEFRSPTNTTPKSAQPGLRGQTRNFKVILKLIADLGLIGLPNAGKSSLLNELTAANAKIGAYPFTTVEPNLGAMEGKIIADIPGLIEGASSGKGLGIQFLKHIEKVKILLHCISSESSDLKQDYLTVREEMEKFNPELLKKTEIIVLTKSDLLNQKQLKEKVADLKFTKRKIYPVSIHNWESLADFKSYL